MRKSSQRKLKETRTRYRRMLASMHRAEKSMAPVLRSFQDNVLFLKHNLNAQAIGSLEGISADLQKDVEDLLEELERSIAEANSFIQEML